MPQPRIHYRPAHSRGHERLDWLEAHFSFSFGGWDDPNWERHGQLRVLNEDRVAPGTGFEWHTHSGVELLLYPLSGAIEHADSLGNEHLLRPGHVHRLHTGDGLQHRQWNASSATVDHHLQFWFLPTRPGEAGYQQVYVEPSEKYGCFRLIAAPTVSPGAVRLHAPAWLYTTRLTDGQQAQLEDLPGRSLYLHLAHGEVAVRGQRLTAGDALILADIEHIDVQGLAEDSELLTLIQP